MKSINVFYDAQEGKYYKIDKQTGESLPSHCNGTDFARFKPQYTGADYRMRKSNQKNLKPSYLTKAPFQVSHQHKHTVPLESSPKQSLTRVAKSLATISQGHGSAIMPLGNLPTQGIANNSLVGYQSRLLESRTMPADGFMDRLKQFAKIKDQLRRENHSPKKGFEGSIIQQKIQKEYKNQIIKGNLQQNSYKNKRNRTQHSTNKTIQTSSGIILRDQISRQRQIFFRFNSHLKPQQNERQQKQLRQRKTNLKILQNLFISKNNKDTMVVYQ